MLETFFRRIKSQIAVRKTVHFYTEQSFHGQFHLHNNFFQKKNSTYVCVNHSLALLSSNAINHFDSISFCLYDSFEGIIIGRNNTEAIFTPRDDAHDNYVRDESRLRINRRI